jgi:hypothetical protein
MCVLTVEVLLLSLSMTNADRGVSILSYARISNQ